MTSIAPPICMGCKRYRREGVGFACEAYPNGIPSEILEGKVDHRKPYKGDGGKQFDDNGKYQIASDGAYIAGVKGGG